MLFIEVQVVIFLPFHIFCQTVQHRETDERGVQKVEKDHELGNDLGVPALSTTRPPKLN